LLFTPTDDYQLQPIWFFDIAGNNGIEFGFGHYHFLEEFFSQVR